MILATNTNRHDRVVVTGGGTAGLSVAATLLRQPPKLDVAVIDPSEDHYYQPSWMLVWGGDMRAEDTRRAPSRRDAGQGNQGQGGGQPFLA